MIVHLLIHLLGGSVSMKANGCVVKRVHCEHCGEDYIYQLRRKVTCSTYAIFHIGIAQKRLAITQKVHRKLELAIQDGVDPVPCPACGWLQKNMVAARQKRAMKNIAIAALVLAGVILFLCAVADAAEIPFAAIAWITAIGIAALTFATLYIFLVDPNGAAHRRTRDVLGLKCRAMPAAEFDALLAEGTYP